MLYFCIDIGLLDGWWKDCSLSGVRIERGKEALRGGASANYSFGLDYGERALIKYNKKSKKFVSRSLVQYIFMTLTRET